MHLQFIYANIAIRRQTRGEEMNDVRDLTNFQPKHKNDTKFKEMNCEKRKSP